MSFNLGTLPAWGAVAIAMVSAVFALVQLRANERARRVDRVIQMHQSLTGGEVGAARDRFTSFMWRVGDSGESATQGPYRPTIDSLIAPAVAAPPPDGEQGRLAYYPDDLTDSGGIAPLQDLYKVLWCFERIEAARSHNTLDRDLLVNLIGFHAAWWDHLLGRISDTDSHHRRALRDLAAYCLALRPDLDEPVSRGHERGQSD